ncbi:MAG TPA: inorganic pyrophosphatase, partial [Chloroflexi bacterium]|nr:inorganic pyrophosphatase [Chloroflexota bacterium]
MCPHTLLEIEAFFATYKLLEPKDTEVLGWHEVDEAWEMIERSRETWAAARVARNG